MYVIIKKTQPCFGIKTAPDRYVTGTNRIELGYSTPVLTENIHKAQKFRSKKAAEEKVQFLHDCLEFYVGANFVIEKI